MNSACERFQNEIHELLDARLSHPISKELSNHVVDCTSCRFLLKLPDVCARSSESFPVPSGFSDRVLEQLKDVEPRRVSVTTWIWSAVALAAGLLIATILWMKPGEVKEITPAATGTKDLVKEFQFPSIPRIDLPEIPRLPLDSLASLNSSNWKVPKESALESTLPIALSLQDAVVGSFSPVADSAKQWWNDLEMRLPIDQVKMVFNYIKQKS